MTKKSNEKTIIITRIHEYISGTLVTGIENGPNWTRDTMEGTIRTTRIVRPLWHLTHLD